MRLWLFKRKDKPNWDEYEGFVVRAETAEAARKLLLLGIKNHDYIGVPTRMAVSELHVDGPSQVIIEAFNAG